ncbi:10867_t:CDS:1 [Dentiscutata heterogama]|uniref:10867_t:CDS:1 n=1 Tax=Dentiscutata heterogama TaxID=1316150 RepID=A0ACA9PVE5_9GLOM|nr:10867_t:CDS:1 [Dentiscutata heterogama]
MEIPDIDINNIIQCDICYNSSSDTGFIYPLPCDCKNNVCKSCVKNIKKKNGKETKCPFCNKKKFNENGEVTRQEEENELNIFFTIICIRVDLRLRYENELAILETKYENFKECCTFNYESNIDELNNNEDYGDDLKKEKREMLLINYNISLEKLNKSKEKEINSLKMKYRILAIN